MIREVFCAEPASEDMPKINDIHSKTGTQERRRFAKRDGRREFKELG